jgi:hypothetical protein
MKLKLIIHPFFLGILYVSVDMPLFSTYDVSNKTGQREGTLVILRSSKNGAFVSSQFFPAGETNGSSSSNKSKSRFSEQTIVDATGFREGTLVLEKSTDGKYVSYQFVQGAGSLNKESTRPNDANSQRKNSEPATKNSDKPGPSGMMQTFKSTAAAGAGFGLGFGALSVVGKAAGQGIVGMFTGGDQDNKNKNKNDNKNDNNNNKNDTVNYGDANGNSYNNYDNSWE